MDEWHTRGVGPGPWWFAHDYPERDPDQWMVSDWACDGCFMHLRAAANRCPWMIVYTKDVLGVQNLSSITIEQAYRDACRWRERIGATEQ